MYRITILAVGKLYEPCWQLAEELFATRLTPHVRLSIEEIEAEALGSTVAPSAVLRREGERLLRRIPADAEVVVLEKEGKMVDSPGFARFLEELGGSGHHIVFVIGGSIGLAEEVRQRGRQRISFSKMTFTHEMARVILLEQVYRAMMILGGRPYHK